MNFVESMDELARNSKIVLHDLGCRIISTECTTYLDALRLLVVLSISTALSVADDLALLGAIDQDRGGTRCPQY
jgi:hypothetical protein